MAERLTWTLWETNSVTQNGLISQGLKIILVITIVADNGVCQKINYSDTVNSTLLTSTWTWLNSNTKLWLLLTNLSLWRMKKTRWLFLKKVICCLWWIFIRQSLTSIIRLGRNGMQTIKLYMILTVLSLAVTIAYLRLKINYSHGIMSLGVIVTIT